MSGIWGKNLRLAIFGESHGPAIGITIDGLPPGLQIDEDVILTEMGRRRPGHNAFSTPRREADQPEVVSGLLDGVTTGAPLTAIIRNTNTRSQDYNRLNQTVRPGQTDYSGIMRYDGYHDYRGSGHFSGRITAPLVFAGAIANQWLLQQGITIGSRICSVGQVEDPTPIVLESMTSGMLQDFRAETFPLLDTNLAEAIEEEILQARADQDAVGGVVETFVLGLPAGIGNPFFDSIEATLAHLVFSVPATKGIEFGSGFEIARLRASQANDSFYYDEQGAICTRTAHNGGIIGGISIGTPINFKVAVKPPASIEKEQQTVNLETGENVTLSIHGRHDPCIVHRVLPVIDAVTAIGLMDLMMSRVGSSGN